MAEELTPKQKEAETRKRLGPRLRKHPASNLARPPKFYGTSLGWRPRTPVAPPTRDLAE